MHEVQIRVIKTEFYPDIAEKYLSTGRILVHVRCMKQGMFSSTRGIMKNLKVFVPLHGLTYAVRLLPSQMALRIMRGTTEKDRR